MMPSATPPKNSPPTGAPVKKAMPSVKSGSKPPPAAKKAPGPPVSSAFQAGAPQPQGQSTPMAAPADVASNLAHLTGKAIAQAILGGFAQQIAQPK